MSFKNSYIDANKQKFIKNLEEAVAIKSVSAWPDTRQEIFRMVKWAGAKLEELGACIELKELGKQVTPECPHLQQQNLI